MRADLSKSPDGKAFSTSMLGYIRLLPFYLITLFMSGYLAYLVPKNFEEIVPSVIVPADTAPEKVMDYLKAISAQDRALLIGREKQRYLESPLERSTLFNMSVLYGLDGDTQKSNELAVQAANRSFRDLGAQTTVINISLSQKNYPDALNRIDGLLRSRPNFSKNYFPIILTIATSKEGLSAIAKLLQKDPPWRRSFFEFAAEQPTQKTEVYALLTSLRDLKVDVPKADIRLFIDHLFEAKDYETAYFVWLDFLSPAGLAKVGLLFDGGFDLPADNMRFGWNLIPVKNVELKIQPKANVGNDMALNLRFSAIKQSLPSVAQSLRLDAGNYVLKGELKAEQLKSPAGLSWRVICYENLNQIGASEAIAESTPWKAFSFQFSVPADNCATQQLYLNWVSAAALDQTIDGSIVFDNFQIEKID